MPPIDTGRTLESLAAQEPPPFISREAAQEIAALAYTLTQNAIKKARLVVNPDDYTPWAQLPETRRLLMADGVIRTIQAMQALGYIDPPNE